MRSTIVIVGPQSDELKRILDLMDVKPAPGMSFYHSLGSDTYLLNDKAGDNVHQFQFLNIKPNKLGTYKQQIAGSIVILQVGDLNTTEIAMLKSAAPSLTIVKLDNTKIQSRADLITATRAAKDKVVDDMVADFIPTEKNLVRDNTPPPRGLSFWDKISIRFKSATASSSAEKPGKTDTELDDKPRKPGQGPGSSNG